MSQSRQLAAIMFTDIVGYTSLMGKNEENAFRILNKNRELQKPIIEQFNGRWIKELGDGVMASFNTVSDSVNAAIKIQKESNTVRDLQLRIGIHLGEVVFENEDVFGDGVNIASRIQAFAVPGSIYISEAIQNNISNKQGIVTKFVKQEKLKNVVSPIRIYEVLTAQETHSSKKTNRESIQESSAKSIAVLPFVNMSNDPEQEYFCDGISEEIINTIVQYPDLKVSGRTSSFIFKGKNEDLRVIGNALGVGKILEGSIRKMGNQIRITAQLIETSNGFHLWSKKYDRQLDDIFAIQDEIAKEIGNQLNLTLSAGAKKLEGRQQTQNLEAYELYLKGRGLFYKRGTALLEALDCFKKALEIDKTYALASSGLADTYVMLILHAYLPASDNWKYAIKAANTAFRYGPELAETYNSKAIISLFYEWNWDQAADQFKKAISINPSFIQAYVWYGFFYQYCVKGNAREGIKLMKKAIEIDPLSSYARNCLVPSYTILGLYDVAIQEMNDLSEIDPTQNLTAYNLSAVLFWSGNHKKAYEILENSSGKSGKIWIYFFIYIYLKMNQKEKAEKIYSKIEREYKNNGLLPTSFAIAAATFGKNKKAIELLHNACDVKDPALILLALNHKDGEILHSLPGYNDIRKRMGLKEVHPQR
ncbi:MAG: adenylate/guanylate cyclase domain-containing protein [Bacteroidales bacterium]|nr:adenylate/guanylate cyclase domain-containing protein [Bacteroidales bacterium]